eukprot:7210382-Pyramimonas_sp.AAC.2
MYDSLVNHEGEDDGRYNKLPHSSSASRNASWSSSRADQEFQRCQGFQTSRQSERNASAKRKLVYALAICVVAVFIEVIGGLIANSLSLLTDAAHLLSDLAGNDNSFGSLNLSEKGAKRRSDMIRIMLY